MVSFAVGIGEAVRSAPPMAIRVDWLAARLYLSQPSYRAGLPYDHADVGRFEQPLSRLIGLKRRNYRDGD